MYTHPRLEPGVHLTDGQGARDRLEHLRSRDEALAPQESYT
jgi:hypothetical protein